MRCGCSERDGGTTVLEPQQLLFRKCCKTNGLSNILRQRGGARGRHTFTNPLNRQNPYSQRPVWGFFFIVNTTKICLLDNGWFELLIADTFWFRARARIPPGQVYWFVFFGFVVCWFVGLRSDNFCKKRSKVQFLNLVKNRKIVENPSQIGPKSIHNQPKR